MDRANKSIRPWLTAIALVTATGVGNPLLVAAGECPAPFTFGAPIPMALQSFVQRSITADINADGMDDIVFASRTSQVGVVLGGNPPNAPQFFTPSLDAVYAIAVRDLNNDGSPDLILGGFEAGPPAVEVLLFAGASQGQIPQYSSLGVILIDPRPTWLDNVFCLDMNGDQLLDVVTVDLNPAQVSIIPNVGTSTNPQFASTSFGFFTHDGSNVNVDAGDINGDGIGDIVLTRFYNPPGLQVYLSNGPTWSFLSIPVQGDPYDAKIVDIDADGQADIVAAGLGYVCALYGKRSGGVFAGFTSATSYPTSLNQGTSIAIADLNHDSVLDVVASGGLSPGLTILFGERPSGATRPTYMEVPQVAFDVGYASGSTVGVGDFNGDSLVDVMFVGVFGASYRLVVYPNLCPPAETLSPRIRSIADVPLDQGGWVQLSWYPSGFDRFANDLVRSYRVWRSVPTDIAMMSIRAGAAVVTLANSRAQVAGAGNLYLASAAADSFWEYLAETPASGLGGYSYIASTPYDSTSLGNPKTDFFIQALAADGTYHFDSPVDSGYSVDNLPPERLGGLGGYFVLPASVQIHWGPSKERDLSFYTVYRGANETFIPGPQDRIGTTTDTTALAGFLNAAAYFKITATDIHGNESEPALLAPYQISGVEHYGAPRAAYLNQNHPNPFNPETNLEFGLSTAGRVTLRIFDLSGRMIRTVIDEYRGPGRYRVPWNGKTTSGADVPSGVYLAELRANQSSRMIKMTVLR